MPRKDEQDSFQALLDRLAEAHRRETMKAEVLQQQAEALRRKNYDLASRLARLAKKVEGTSGSPHRLKETADTAAGDRPKETAGNAPGDGKFASWARQFSSSSAPSGSASSTLRPCAPEEDSLSLGPDEKAQAACRTPAPAPRAELESELSPPAVSASRSEPSCSGSGPDEKAQAPCPKPPRSESAPRRRDGSGRPTSASRSGPRRSGSGRKRSKGSRKRQNKPERGGPDEKAQAACRTPPPRKPPAESESQSSSPAVSASGSEPSCSGSGPGEKAQAACHTPPAPAPPAEPEPERSPPAVSASRSEPSCSGSGPDEKAQAAAGTRAQALMSQLGLSPPRAVPEWADGLSQRSVVTTGLGRLSCPPPPVRNGAQTTIFRWRPGVAAEAKGVLKGKLALKEGAAAAGGRGKGTPADASLHVVPLPRSDEPAAGDGGGDESTRYSARDEALFEKMDVPPLEPPLETDGRPEEDEVDAAVTRRWQPRALTADCQDEAEGQKDGSAAESQRPEGPQAVDEQGRLEPGDMVLLGHGVPPEFRQRRAVVTKLEEIFCTVVALDDSGICGLGECWPALSDVKVLNRSLRLGSRVLIDGMTAAKTRPLNGHFGIISSQAREGHPTFLRRKASEDARLAVCVKLEDPPRGTRRFVLVEPRFIVSEESLIEKAAADLRDAIGFITPRVGGGSAQA